jgi:hypothetical protein
MWPKSNNIAVFALDPKTVCERKHMMFGFLNVANLTQSKCKETLMKENVMFYNHKSGKVEMKFCFKN